MSSFDVTGEAADEVRQRAPDIETLAIRLAEAADYLVDESLATSMFLSLRLPQPLLLEGEAGVGIALMEVITFDEEGNCLNGSFMEYLIPTALECPDFELGETVTPCPHHPLGAKGVGESPNVGSPPAIVNAVIDALHETHGVTHIDMPCTPARVWAAMQGRPEPPQ